MNTLIVDDDPVSRLALVDLLRGFDLGTCGEFESATAAWEYLRLNPPPMLVCCDIRMPGMTGLEFLAKIKTRKELQRLPVVLVSSTSDRELVQEAIQLGASGYIVKPFTPQETFGRIQGFLQGAWDDIAESPSSTLRRLGITTSKLEAYFTAFRRQIDDIHSLLAALPPNGILDNGLIERIHTIQTGCLTLGLWHAGRIIEALERHPNPRLAIKLHLSAVGEALDLQRRWTRDGSWRNEPLQT